MMVKKLLSSIAGSGAAGQLVGVLERLDGQTPDVLRVLTYHRIDDPARAPDRYPRVTVPPAAFEQQMRALCSGGRYGVVSMQEVVDALAGKRRLPPNPVLITFDDATRDFTENALPVLRSLGLPSTVFVPTAFPDHPERVFWWDRLYAAIEKIGIKKGVIETPLGRLTLQTRGQRKESFGKLRDFVKSLPHDQAMAFVDQLCNSLDAPQQTNDVLSWAELRDVAKQGVTLGAHTQTHPMMNRISRQAIHDETAGSLRDLRREIGEVLPVFAYPSGGYTGEVMEILKQEGVQLAFTTQRGLNDLRKCDPLQMKRINVGPRTTIPLLRAQMLGMMKHITR